MKHLSAYIARLPLNLAALERQAGVPANTLSNHYGSLQRSVSDANWIAILKVLCPCVINFYTFTFDPEDGSFVVSWEDTDRRRKIREYKPGTFTYWVPTQRDLIAFGEEHELKWYLDTVKAPAPE